MEKNNFPKSIHCMQPIFNDLQEHFQTQESYIRFCLAGLHEHENTELKEALDLCLSREIIDIKLYEQIIKLLAKVPRFEACDLNTFSSEQCNILETAHALMLLLVDELDKENNLNILTLNKMVSALPGQKFDEVRGIFEQLINLNGDLKDSNQALNILIQADFYLTCGIYWSAAPSIFIEKAQALMLAVGLSRDVKVSEEFREIFIEEVKELQEQINDCISIELNLFFSEENISTLKRNLHTLKGSARMVGFTKLGEYVHQLEQLYEGCLLLTDEKQQESYQRIQSGHAYLTELLRSIERQQQLEDVEAKTIALHAMVDKKSVELESVDESLVEIFKEEVDEINEQVVATFECLIDAPTDSSKLSDLLRDLHTLKGSAKMVGLKSIGEQVHQLESQCQQSDRNSFITLFDAYLTIKDALDVALKPVKPKSTIVQKSLDYHQRDDVTAQIESIHQLLRIIEETGDVTQHELTALTSLLTIVNVVKMIDASKYLRVGKIDAGKNMPAISYLIDCCEAINRGKPLPEMKIGQNNQLKADRRPIRVSANIVQTLNKMVGVANISGAHLGIDVEEIAQDIAKITSEIHYIRNDCNQLDDELQHQSLTNPRIRTLFKNIRENLDLMTKNNQHARDMLYSVESLLFEQKQAVTAMQKGLTDAQVVPFTLILPRLEKIISQLCLELGKNVSLIPKDTQSLLDRQILERLVPTLEHMLRNALDHAIESPEARLAAGKTANGKIELSVSRSGSNIVITFKDDGKGIDASGIRRKAVERGLLEPDVVLSDEELLRFILQPGFSTRDAVTQVSGRGVGMDVVNSDVEALGGTLMIRTDLGKGTTFTITLPFTQSLVEVLLFLVDQQWYGIRVHHIDEILRVSYDEALTLLSGEEAFVHNNQTYSIKYLGDLMHGKQKPALEYQHRAVPIIVLKVADTALVLVVDHLVGARKVILRSVGPQLKHVKEFTGASVLPDGKVALVLDVNVLEHMVLHDKKHASKISTSTQASKVMVVDDSMTIRKMTKKLLDKNGYQTILAKDGLDALSLVHEDLPDIILLDIDMPRMNGYEVATRIRSNELTKHIPIIVISSRNTEDHFKLAKEVGANHVMMKPYQEEQLIGTMQTLLGE